MNLQHLLGKQAKQFQQNHDNCHILRTHPYYLCFKQDLILPNSKFTIQSYRLVSLANIYTPLLAVYNKLAPFSSAQLTTTLIKFLAKALEAYRHNKQSDFEQLIDQLYYPGIGEENKTRIQRVLNDLNMMTDEQLKRLQLNLKQFLKAQWRVAAQPVQSAAEMQIISYKLLNLERYKIIPRRLKIQKLKQLTKSLNHFFHTELVLDETNQQVTIRIKKQFHTQKIVTLEHYWLSRTLEQDKRTLFVTEKQIQNAYNKIFHEMIEITKALGNYHYKPHPSNILIHFGTQTPFFREVGEEIVSIDLMPLFMEVLGLKEKPSTLEEMLIFSKELIPTLYKYDFKQALKILNENNRALNSTKLEQIDSIICWILAADFIIKKLMRMSGQSCLQGLNDKYMEAIDILRQLSENSSNIVDSEMTLMIELFEIDCRDCSGFMDYDYQKWRNQLSEDEKDEYAQTSITLYLQENKFSRSKLILESMNYLFLDEDKLKNTIQKNKLFIPIENVGRYLFIYFLAKFLQLTLEANILSSNYQYEDILHQKYGLRKDIDRIKNLTERIENKIDNQYDKRRNTDFNRKWMKQNQEFMNLYKQLKLKRCDNLCGLATNEGVNVKPQSQGNRLLSEAKQFRSKIKYHCWKLMYYEKGQQSNSTYQSNIKNFREKPTYQQKAEEIKNLRAQKHQCIRRQKMSNSQQYFSYLKYQLYMLVFLSYQWHNYSLMKQFEAQIAEDIQSWQKGVTDIHQEQQKLMNSIYKQIQTQQSSLRSYL